MKTPCLVGLAGAILRLLLDSIGGGLCEDDTTEEVGNEAKCREKSRLITSDNGDMYALTEVSYGEKLVLQCHYCKENDDGQPKIWYKLNIWKNTSEEVHLDMKNKMTANRIHINPQHSLIIHNFTANDTGLYSCQGLEQQERENKYNFLTDLVLNSNTSISYERGNLTHWRKYREDYMAPLNKMFRESQGVEFKKVRDELHLQLEVVTEWEYWGICEVCGRPQGQGKKRKKGYCRLKINPQKRNNSKTLNLAKFNETELFVMHTYELSCRSATIAKLFPSISNLTSIIPHFVQEEHCEGMCNPDAEGVYKGWKTTKKGFKYKKSIVLAENAHLTLVCPESTLQNVVVWKRNGKELKAGESVEPEKKNEEPRITVDTFNSLYLTAVKDSEEGNYTCEVDGVRMQQVRVFIVSKSKLLTQAFVRHVMYLAFILSLTLTCYCAGLVVTCKRRHEFKTYEEVKELEEAKQAEIERLYFK